MQIITTVPWCLCVPTTPGPLIHSTLLKRLFRTSKARWRIAAPGPKGTQGLSCSEGPTNVPGTPWRATRSRKGSGTSMIRYAVDGGAVICVVSTVDIQLSSGLKVDPDARVPLTRWVVVATHFARAVVGRAPCDIAVVGEIGPTDRQVVESPGRHVMNRTIEC